MPTYDIRKTQYDIPNRFASVVAELFAYFLLSYYCLLIRYLAYVGRMSMYGVKYLCRKAREGLYVISSVSITKKSYDDNMQINFSTQIKRNKTSTLIFSLGSFLLGSWHIYKGSCISLHQSVYLKISVLVCWSVKQ